MIRGLRRAFADVVARQLDLFATEHAAELAEIADARKAWGRASREQAEERYAEYLDAAADAREGLLALRDTYAATLEGRAEERYRAAFDRAVERRWPSLARNQDAGLFEDDDR
jgi:hypothetical protein